MNAISKAIFYLLFSILCLSLSAGVARAQALGPDTILHNFGGTVTNANGTKVLDGNNPFAGVTFDSAGNMYGTTTKGGANAQSSSLGGMIWEITASGIYTDLHDF